MAALPPASCGEGPGAGCQGEVGVLGVWWVAGDGAATHPRAACRTEEKPSRKRFLLRCLLRDSLDACSAQEAEDILHGAREQSCLPASSRLCAGGEAAGAAGSGRQRQAQCSPINVTLHLLAGSKGELAFLVITKYWVLWGSLSTVSLGFGEKGSCSLESEAPG